MRRGSLLGLEPSAAESQDFRRLPADKGSLRIALSRTEEPYATCTLPLMEGFVAGGIFYENGTMVCQPILICCGLPVVWMTLQHEDVWDAECAWCGREFCYSEARFSPSATGR